MDADFDQEVQRTLLALPFVSFLAFSLTAGQTIRESVRKAEWFCVFFHPDSSGL